MNEIIKNSMEKIERQFIEIKQQHQKKYINDEKKEESTNDDKKYWKRAVQEKQPIQNNQNHIRNNKIQHRQTKMKCNKNSHVLTMILSVFDVFRFNVT